MLGVSVHGPVASGGTTGSLRAVVAPSDLHDHIGPDPYAAERDAWTVLTAVHGLGPLGFAALLHHFGTGGGILATAAASGGILRLQATPPLEANRMERPIGPVLARAITDVVERADAIVARVRDLGIRVLTLEEPAYPARLSAVEMPPHVVFVTGDPAALSANRSVAVVGTRYPTSAGRTTAGRIATALVAAESVVVSGLAFGIDGVAHETTIRAGGTTVAVIGGGHAVLSPPAHARLAAAIVASGGAVVSELTPDTVPSKGTFPRRNRIISGLSDATVVVEAPARSGALITASWAMDQGRPCFIVPGAIDARASAGCLAFLREFEHAVHVVAGIPQLIADLGFVQPSGDRRDALSAATSQALGITEAAVAAELIAGRATIDELVAATDLPVAAVLAALTLLERRGLAAGAYGRYRPAGTLLGAPPRIKVR